MSVAFLFPGQGAQRPGMLADLPATRATDATVTEARAVCADLGVDNELDAADRLRDTVATQLCLLIAGVACARSLIESAPTEPEFVAGHSVGAFAAATVAGVLTLREALTAVHIRAESMRAACADGQWGMAAVTGLATRAVAGLVARAREPLWVANINAPTQTVLGGTTGALTAARDAARAAGATDYAVLDVSVASHGAVQSGTAATLHEHLAGVPRREPTMRYITNERGRSVSAPDSILADLASSVASPVRWSDGVRLLPELGASHAVEMMPGHTLTRITEANTSDLTVLALTDLGMAGTAARLRSA